MRLDRGYISPYFVTDPKTMKAELDNPYILIVEKKVSGCAAGIAHCGAACCAREGSQHVSMHRAATAACLLPILEADVKAPAPSGSVQVVHAHVTRARRLAPLLPVLEVLSSG